LRLVGTGGLFKAEAVRPGDDGPEEQLVVGKDHQRHHPHGPADRTKILMLDRNREVGADARQRDGGIANRDGLRGDDEEPSSGHRHHRVPDQRGGRERQIEPQEAADRGQGKASHTSSRSSGKPRSDW